MRPAMALDLGRRAKAPRERFSAEYVGYVSSLFAASAAYSERLWPEQAAALQGLLDLLLTAEKQQAYELLESFYGSGFLDSLAAFFCRGDAPVQARLSCISTLNLLVQNSRNEGLRTFLFTSGAGGRIALSAATSGAEELAAFASSYLRSFGLEFNPRILRELHLRGDYSWLRSSIDLMTLGDPTLSLAVQTEVLAVSGLLKRYQNTSSPSPRALFEWMLSFVYVPLCAKLWRDAASVAMEITVRAPGGYCGEAPSSAAPQLRTLLERLSSVIAFLADLCCFGVEALPRLQADEAYAASLRAGREARAGRDGLFPAGPPAGEGQRRPSAGRDRRDQRDQREQREVKPAKEPAEGKRRLFGGRKKDNPPEAGGAKHLRRVSAGATSASGATDTQRTGEVVAEAERDASFAVPAAPVTSTSALMDLPFLGFGGDDRGQLASTNTLEPQLTDLASGPQVYDFSSVLCEIVVSQFMEEALPHVLRSLANPTLPSPAPWAKASAERWLNPQGLPWPGSTLPPGPEMFSPVLPGDRALAGDSASAGDQPVTQKFSVGVAFLFLLFVLEKNAGTKLGEILHTILLGNNLAQSAVFSSLFLAKPVLLSLETFYARRAFLSPQTVCIPPSTQGNPGPRATDLSDLLSGLKLAPQFVWRAALQQQSTASQVALDPGDGGRERSNPGRRGFGNAVKEVIFAAIDFQRSLCTTASALKGGDTVDATISKLLGVHLRYVQASGLSGGVNVNKGASFGAGVEGTAGSANRQHGQVSGSPVSPTGRLMGCPAGQESLSPDGDLAIAAMGFVDLTSETQAESSAVAGSPAGAACETDSGAVEGAAESPPPATVPGGAGGPALCQAEKEALVSYSVSVFHSLWARPVQLVTSLYFAEFLALSGLGRDARVAEARKLAVRRLRAASEAQRDIFRAEDSEMRENYTESEADIRCKAVPDRQDAPVFSRRDRLNPLLLIMSSGGFAASDAILGVLESSGVSGVADLP